MGGGGGTSLPALSSPPIIKEAPKQPISDPNICKIVHNNRLINAKKCLNNAILRKKTGIKKGG